MQKCDNGRRPNVLVLISDDTAPEYLGPYGGPYPTPNFNWLASEGMRFSRHEVVAPICTPSRYAYLTGCLPSRSTPVSSGADYEPRSIGFESAIYPGEDNAASVFKENGYTTAFVGKFHCGRQADVLGLEHITSEMLESEADGCRKRNQGRVTEELHRLGWDYAEHIAWGNIDWEPWIKLDTHNLEWTTEGAVQFLREQAEDQSPFFMVVSTNVIHGPKHGGNIVTDDPLLTPAGRLEKAPESGHPSRQSVVDRLTDAGLGATHRAVGTVWLDDCLGVLREELEAIGELDNTIIVYQSDHSVCGKSSCHVSGARTGFLARWPSVIPQNSVCSHMVQNIDFLPTLIELIGLDVDSGLQMDGRSYAPALKGDEFEPLEDFYNEVGVARSVQTAEYKYISVRYQPAQIAAMKADEAGRVMNQIGLWDVWMPELYHRHYWDSDQLYRVDHDEQEQINLAGIPRYSEVLADMKVRLRRHLERTGQVFPSEPDPFQESDEFRARVTRRMKHGVEGIPYFHNGGW